MNYFGTLETYMKYDDINLDMFHIYNKILRMNDKIREDYGFEFVNIRTVYPKYQSEPHYILIIYGKENERLEIKIYYNRNYTRNNIENKLKNITVNLEGENIKSDDLINISNSANNIFKGER